MTVTTHLPTFPSEEYQNRLAQLRRKMKQEELDACILSTPESLYWLTGLSHWGFFALHVLVVPREGDLYMVARAMEQVTMANQLDDHVQFRGHKDSETAIDTTVVILNELGLERATIGLDLDTVYRSYNRTKQLMDAFPHVTWQDSEHLVDRLRYVKSPLEISAMRQAATISERMMDAAVRATQPGVSEKVIASEVFKEMVLAGGEPPSFGPFIRPKSRLGEEHGTWGSDIITRDDRLFVELSGCYGRYHAPMGRFVYLDPPKQSGDVQAVCIDAFKAVLDTMRPGATANDVYHAWQNVVNDAGLSDYKRHHCGYMTGMTFPPTWMQDATISVVGLREGSDLVLEAGMTFHVLSWLVGSRIGDYFISDTVLVTDQGGETLTTTPHTILTA